MSHRSVGPSLIYILSHVCYDYIFILIHFPLQTVCTFRKRNGFQGKFPQFSKTSCVILRFSIIYLLIL